MLRLVQPWCMPAQQRLQEALTGDEGQMVDACRALAGLCAGHQVQVLEAASAAAAAAEQQQQQQQHTQQLTIFLTLEELLRSFLAAGGVTSSSSPEPWLADC